ncbi:hypothetical protein ACEXQB_007615 [Herbiconiux sp. P18]|uniref:hypothetical protein n=1 Tax=Herbiconiux liangxiaofengii TaxID=3342795 RepID=UPI0035B96215
MSDTTVTQYAHHKFGSDSARPKIVGVYRGVGGWQRPAGPERLTKDSAERLRADGVTMIRVRWRLRTMEIILRKYLGA